jgi:hypothetical protein
VSQIARPWMDRAEPWTEAKWLSSENMELMVSWLEGNDNPEHLNWVLGGMVGERPGRSCPITPTERQWELWREELRTQAEPYLHLNPPPFWLGAALLRCVFGNPWRPVRVSLSDGRRPVDLAGNFDLLPRRCLTDRVVALARELYESRQWEALPVLADALEEAGCTVPDVLDHLRGPGPHARGCWVMDLILGKI